MTYSTTHNRRNQGGFTLPEILAVIALISILISVISTNFGNASRDLSLASSKDTLLNDIPAAMMSYRAINGSLTGMDKADLTSNGVPDKSPDGDAWAVGTVTSRSAVINWLLSGADEAETFAADLQKGLPSSGSSISSTSYDKNSKTLAVTYKVP